MATPVLPWGDQARHRTFQVWEYHASHGCLLLRSPKGGDVATNLDLLCASVAYVELPRVLSGLEVAEPTEEETARVVRVLGPDATPSIRVLVSGGNRFVVAAARFVEQEHDKDPMVSFLAPRKVAAPPGGRSGGTSRRRGAR